ncbi:release factor glutamine methyltransferase [Algoriphagus boseongensis]|uniref:Release factor glutamine methyltransferase n=1 Tax=Algoriphagus boseongensis TaxID=1442587 RepID=A0A4R6T287_9BACT|nr:peptide chain release factor N(5)-glutamine methyltransferase [Algoriphagus boseongensis]TDQ14626.1 release factor glutamine methyltransferase [Algoriphagus boseongensis]
MSISYQEFSQKLSLELTPLYDSQEAQNLVEWLLEHHLGLKRMDLFKFMKEEALPEVLYSDLERLKEGEPIQYILGHCPFYGRDFKVNQHTLIPRNETEELVHLIIKENPKPGLKILDIGTGTGCIPISLSLEMTSPEVFGLDISEGAIEVAKENALKNRAQVKFLNCDILKSFPDLPQLDIIVSNPPYVPQSEKKEMHQNVVEFEPHLALFVPDSDPLVFYRVIAEKSKDLLNPGGKLYFEIYEKAGTEISDLLKNLGFDQIKLHKDLNGKDRIISAVLA